MLPSGQSIDILNGGHQNGMAQRALGVRPLHRVGYFSFVALNFADTTALDHIIEADLKANHHYHVLYVVPYGPDPYVVWQYWTSQGRRSPTSRG